MKAIENQNTSAKTDWVSKAKRVAFIVVGGLISLLIILILFRLTTIYAVYSFALQKVSSIFGLDQMLSRAIAVGVTSISILITPWVVGYVFFGRRKVEVTIAGSLIAIAFCFAIYFGTENVFFDRETGQPAKYYIKTTSGYKFSSQADTDPVFGVKYKPINQEVIKEFLAWKKTGVIDTSPEVTSGEYFDRLTGEPKAWYVKRANGSIHISSLPGYDTLTGEPMHPITKEVVTQLGNLTEGIQLDSGPRVLLNAISYQARIKSEVAEKQKDGEPAASKMSNEYLQYAAKSYGTLEAWALSGNVGQPVKSQSVCLSYNYKGNQELNFAVEKIIPLPPKNVVIVGVFDFSDEIRHLINDQVHLIDQIGTSHKVMAIHTKWDNSERIDGVTGEKRKVFFIFQFVHPSKLKEGALNLEGKLVKFNL